MVAWGPDESFAGEKGGRCGDREKRVDRDDDALSSKDIRSAVAINAIVSESSTWRRVDPVTPSDPGCTGMGVQRPQLRIYDRKDWRHEISAVRHVPESDS